MAFRIAVSRSTQGAARRASTPSLSREYNSESEDTRSIGDKFMP